MSIALQYIILEVKNNILEKQVYTNTANTYTFLTSIVEIVYVAAEHSTYVYTGHPWLQQ